MKIISLLLSLVLPFLIKPVMAIDNDVISQEPKIDKIRELVTEKVREKIDEITNFVPEKKGYFGIIKSLDPNVMTINFSSLSNSFNLQASVDTTIQSTAGKKVEFTGLKIGDSILAMGYLDKDTNTLDARRILLVKPEDYQTNFVLISGKITDISQSGIGSLVPLSNKDKKFQLKFTSSTKYQTRKGETIPQSQVAAGMDVIIHALSDPKNAKNLDVKNVILIAPPASPTPTAKP